MVFVNSMSDLFHVKVPDEFIVNVVRVMMKAKWHTYQVLTKRAERLREMLTGKLEFAMSPHIWWGVSVEDVKHGKPRIEHLRATPAKIKFLSVEPLLEDIGTLDLSGIDWVIVGGESGPGARPMLEPWVLNVLRQCRRNKVAFFFKQWGGVQKKKNGRELLGKTYDEFPEVEKYPIPNRDLRRKEAAVLEALFKMESHDYASTIQA
jgi:protein gp37